MPQTKSAKKALRQSERRRQINLKTMQNYRKALRAAKTAADISVLQRALDKAAKTRVIHKNKAARLKSRLTKKLQKIKSQVKKAAPTKASHKRTQATTTKKTKTTTKR